MASPGQPVVHDALKQKSEKDLAGCYDKFFHTFELSMLKTITIQSDLTWIPSIVKHIHPFFEPVIPLLTLLRAEIILPLATNIQGHFYCKTSCNHDIFIKHIVTTLSELQPEHWDDPVLESKLGTSRSLEVTEMRSKLGPPTPALLLIPPTVPRNLPLEQGIIIRSDLGLHRCADQSLRWGQESDSDDSITAPSNPLKHARLQPPQPPSGPRWRPPYHMASSTSVLPR